MQCAAKRFIAFLLFENHACISPSDYAKITNMKKIAGFWKVLKDTFALSRVHVHVPHSTLTFVNPSNGCAQRVVAKIATGNALLSAGRYLTSDRMGQRYDRIMAYPAQ